MSNRKYLWHAMLSVSLFLSVAAFAQGQGNGGHEAGQNLSEMKFGMFPGMPACATGAVLNGDPAKGPSIIVSKAATGCSVPWHWHTPNEHLMIVKGVANLEMKEGKPLTLRAGGFATMVSKHVHRFRCSSPCVLYVYSDAAYDIHYVDAQGKEISPEVALRAVKGKAPKGAK